MKIDKTFKIKEKYFNAILKLEKPFELRHEQVEPNSIIKLECENGRYLIFKSKGSAELKKGHNEILTKLIEYRTELAGSCYYYIINENGIYEYFIDHSTGKSFDWYDNFCWEYINKAPTYLIEIAEILEVK